MTWRKFLARLAGLPAESGFHRARWARKKAADEDRKKIAAYDAAWT